MPFGFGRRKAEGTTIDRGAATPVAAADLAPPRTVHFEGFTEEWRLDGDVAITGRLLDALNHRLALPIENVRWAPADGSGDLDAAPGIRTMDPYDMIVVVAGPDSLAPQTEEERVAHRVHKRRFEVAIEAPPYRVVGTLQLYPGTEPESLLDRGTHMFAAVTEPALELDGRHLELGSAEVVLVNRFYVRGIDQVDVATGQPHPRLPGESLGGTTWTERA